MRTSPMCQEHDGKVYELAKVEVGVNYPPLHPWCRSSIAPEIDGISREHMKRWARDPQTGEDMKVPRDMNYQEWQRWRADGQPDLTSWRLKSDQKTGKINVQASDGLIATKHSAHALEAMAKRVVDSNEIEDALKSPLYIYPDRTDKNGDVSRRYLGDKATVNVNPTTGVITTVWRTGSRLRKKYERGK